MVDQPKQDLRLGWINAEWWPMNPSEADPSAAIPSKKIYVPKGYLPFQYGSSLYHYTTVEGLFGIVTENAIWASDVRYMNDAEEVVHGRDLSVAVLRQLAAKARYGHFARILESTTDLLAQSELPQYFVASFSTVDDDLTQWRAYGYNKGICIKLDLSKPDSHRHIYLPMVAAYTMREKLSLIMFTIGKYFREFRLDEQHYRGALPDFLWDEYARSIAQKLQFSFVRFKHESFKSEREIRKVISDPETRRTYQNRNMFRARRYRVRGNLIIPYHRTCDAIVRDKDGTEIPPPPLPISEITIGPMSGQSLCAQSVRDFLSSRGYDPAIVKLSKLPYRAQ